MLNTIEKMTEEQKKIAEDNFFLINAFVEDYIKSHQSFVPMKEDLISECSLYLCYAVLSFNKNFDTKLSTFIWKSFVYAMLKIEDRESRETQRFFCEKEFAKESILRKNRKFVASEDILQIINSLNLPFVDRNLLVRYFVDQVSLSEIAESEGLTKQAIYNRLTKLLRKIKKDMDRNGLSIRDFFLML